MDCAADCCRSVQGREREPEVHVHLWILSGNGPLALLVVAGNNKVHDLVRET